MNELYYYIHNFLKPTYNQESFIRSKINSIVSVMRNNSELSLRETRKGGSFEKGTMLKYNPEADIVLVFNKQTGKKRNWDNLMNIVQKNLEENFPEIEIVESGMIRHRIFFKNNEEKIFFDIVPSYYVDSPLQIASHVKSKIYQGITTIWHIDYFNRNKNLPNFIDVIMLLKDWRNEHKIPLKSFHLELITVSAYHYRVENCNSIENILTGCFKEIQGMLDGKSVFPINWDHYSEDDIIRDYTIPCIIDPANPKDNLLTKIKKEDCVYIKKETLMAINQLNNREYGKIFDPKNYTKHFKQM